MILPSKQRALFRRWFTCRRVLGAFSATLGLALGSLVLLVFSLDRPWVKDRVRAWLLTESGLEVDYEAAHLSLKNGLELEALAVRSPLPLRGRAPELLRVARLRVGLAQRRAVEVDGVGAELTVVIDEQGKSSFDWIPSPGPKPPPTPLSRQPAELFASLSAVDAVRVSDLRVTVVRTEAGKAVERAQITPVFLALTRKRTTPESFELVLGRSGAPLELGFARRRSDGRAGSGSRDGLGAGRALLSLSAELTPERLKAALRLRILEHDSLPALASPPELEIELEGHFDPRAGRSSLRLLRAELSRFATLEGELDWPDTAPPRVRRALGHLDAEKLFELVPRALVPFEARRGTLDLHVEGLSLDAPLRSQRLALAGDLEDVKLGLGAGSIAASRARVSLAAEARERGLGVEGKLALDSLDWLEGAHSLHGEALTLALSGEGSSAFTGDVELRFGALAARGATPVTLRDGQLSARLRDVALQDSAPRGDVTFDVRVASLESRAHPRVTASALALHGQTPLSRTEPLSLDAELSAGRLRVLDAEGRALTDAPAHAVLELERVLYDASVPERSEGAARARLELGRLTARVNLEKAGERVDFELGSSGPLAPVRAFFPESLAERVPFSEMSFDLRSKGRLGRVLSSDPELREHTTLILERPAFGSLAADSLALDLRSAGTTARQEAHAELRAEGVRVAGFALGDEALVLDASIDDGARSALDVTVNGRGALNSAVHASVRLDRERHSLDYDVRSALSGLSSLAPLAPLAAELSLFRGLDLEPLEVRVESRGTLRGVFGAARTLRTLRLKEDPLKLAVAESEHSIRVTGLRWAEGDRAFQVPAASLRVALERDPGHLAADSELVIEEATLGLGRRRVSVTELRDRTRATLRGGFADGELEVSQRMSVRALTQNYLRTYPTGDLKLSIEARRDGRGVIRLSELRFSNEAGGTSISAHGACDITAPERRLSLQTSLRQDLARLSKRPEELVGRGSVALELALASPDLRVFRNQATLLLERAAVSLPRRNIALTGIDGEVPITADVVLGSDGAKLLRTIQVNPYAMLRFADQHPLLRKRSFLSIERIETPFASIAPFAANLQVEQNLLSLSQLELGLRGGTVTGNGIFELDRKNSRVHADIRASGVKSSHGEPFDGNAALVLNMGDRSLEGRADILRIGARHLLDLLDVQDPGRADPALNRIRSALGLGYPERVTISFRHGFANAAVSFGGFARLLKVGDVRGIPIGPLMDRVLSSLTEEEL